MKVTQIITILGGTIIAGIYLFLTSAIRDTYAIWLQTRIFGLLAYLALFLTIFIGEMRLLYVQKHKFKLFRFHTPMAIFATFLVALHFISGALDNYKWGVGVPFTHYLGFTFSDNWMVLISIGTLAFYLILLVGITSHRKNIQRLGFKRWKLVHFLSYLTFFMVQYHSVKLGTDIKESAVSTILHPIFTACFIIILTMLLTRIIMGIANFTSQGDVFATGFLILILVAGTYITATMLLGFQSESSQLREQLSTLQSSSIIYQTRANALVDDVNNLQAEVNTLEGDASTLRSEVTS